MRGKILPNFFGRQRETEKVITLRAKKETLNSELDNLVSDHLTDIAIYRAFITS